MSYWSCICFTSDLRHQHGIDCDSRKSVIYSNIYVYQGSVYMIYINVELSGLYVPFYVTCMCSFTDSKEQADAVTHPCRDRQ